MKKLSVICLLVVGLMPAVLFAEGETVVLPRMGLPKITLDEALGRLKIERAYADRPLSLNQVSTLLWIAAGRKQAVDALTTATRTYASAGGIYPLRIFVVVGAVEKMDPGVYDYLQNDHALKNIQLGDFREDIAIAASAALFVAQAPITLLLTAGYKPTTDMFGDRGKQLYIPFEAGAAFQNLRIAALSLGLSVGIAGEFDHSEMQELLGIKDDPLLLLSVGYSK